ncbi:MAG: glycosyltransferase [Candidatus Hodarchaeota archaeon]
MPTYNDSEGLKTTVESLINQDFSKTRYEVIIVDNNSKDNTSKVIKEYERDYEGLVVGLLQDKIQSSYASRNEGIKHSKGEMLVFIDADMHVKEDFLSKVYNHYKSKNIYYAGCNVEIFGNKDTFLAIYCEKKNFLLSKTIKYDHYAPTCCLITNREIFDKVGLFKSNVISGGDVEFGHRVHDNNYRLDYLEDVTIYHPARDSLKSIFKKAIRQGRGYFTVIKLNKGKHASLNMSSYIKAIMKNAKPFGRKNGESFEKKVKYKSRFHGLTERIFSMVPNFFPEFIRDWDRMTFRLKTLFLLFDLVEKFFQFLGFQFERLKRM